MNKTKMKNGEVKGLIPVSRELKKIVTEKSAAYFLEQVKSEYMVIVDTCEPHPGFDLSWVPVGELAEMGYRATENHQWIMSTGTNMHVDQIWGKTLMWVLKNDGLFFKQGKSKVVFQPGDWFIFDDCLPHQADATDLSPDDAVFFAWSVQLERLI